MSTDLVAIPSAFKGLSITSPDVAIRQPLAEIVETFVRAAAANSEHSARSYRYTVGHFIAWLEQAQPYVDRIPTEWQPCVELVYAGKRAEWQYGHAPAAILRLVSQATLEAWRDSLDGTPNTIATRLFAVRTFLRVALRENVLTPEQAANMGLRPYVTKIRRDKKPVGRRLSREEVRTLRGAVDTTTNKGKRDLAMVDAMLFGALRREEVASLTPAAFVLDNGRRWLRLTGKGIKTRRIKVHDQWHKSLATWMQTAGMEWDEAGARVDQTRPLFVSVNKGDAIQAQAGSIDANVVERIVAEYAQAAELGKVEPHDLRRTAARNAYDNGAELLEIQHWLGHSDPKTTAHYIGVNEDDGSAVDRVGY
jgi:integrase